MKKKRNSKNLNIFANDDLTTIRARVISELRNRKNVGNVLTVNQKINFLMRENVKILFKISTSSKKGNDELFCDVSVNGNAETNLVIE